MLSQSPSCTLHVNSTEVSYDTFFSESSLMQLYYLAKGDYWIELLLNGCFSDDPQKHYRTLTNENCNYYGLAFTSKACLRELGGVFCCFVLSSQNEYYFLNINITGMIYRKIIN